MVPFFANTGTQVSIDFEKALGNRVDVQESKARLYGINVDP